MKKILTYISVLGIFAAFSCTKTAEFNDGDYALSFEALTSEMETRAGEGDNAYHENDIKTMDWFFFSDEEGTNLLKAYHTTSNTLKVTQADVEAYRLKGKSYLYAVANAPEAVQSKKTLADIKTVPVTTNFTNDEGKLNVENLSFVMDTYDKTTGKYVMALSPKQTADGVAGSKQPKITVPLCRLAVKFTTTVKVKAEVKVTDSFGLEETWTPILNEDDFDVYMMNALKAGYLNGEPIRRVDAASDDNIKNAYFDYDRNLAEVADISEYDESTGKLKGDYFVWQTVDPFYTYPQKWNDTDNSEPYIKIIFPWVSDIKGNSEFHYKVVLPKPTDHVFTLDRNCWYNLTATIAVLGGTENDYVLIEDVEVSVANWAEPSWAMGKGLNSARYFYVPTKEFDVYSDESFDIPINTNSSAVAYITKIEFSDYSKSPTNDLVYQNRIGTNQTSVSSSIFTRDDSRKEYSGTEHDYSVSVNSSDRYNKFVTFSHSLEDIYVKRDITIYIQHSENSNWHETVIIHQHPAIELKKAVDSDGNLIAGDLFVNGRFASVNNAKFGEQYNGYYHSRSGWTGFARTGGVWTPTYKYYGILSDEVNPDLTSTSIYGCLVHEDYVTWVDSPFFITDITVSAFSENNNFYKMSVNGGSEQTIYYKIGDPRVKVSTLFSSSAAAPFNQTWSLVPYLSGERRQGNSYVDVTSNWTNPGDILVASNDDNTRNMIAPHILVSSGLTEGVQGYSPDDFVSYFKRGATYQEAGYPAGRWRLPTEAEIAFIASRQYDGTIPKIFNESVPYFASSGRFVVIPRDRTKPMEYYTYDQLDTDFYVVDEDGQQYGPYPYRALIDAKFIYDAWYWGLEPMSANEYHANGHIENNE